MQSAAKRKLPAHYAVAPGSSRPPSAPACTSHSSCGWVLETCWPLELYFSSYSDSISSFFFSLWERYRAEGKAGTQGDGKVERKERGKRDGQMDREDAERENEAWEKRGKGGAAGRAGRGEQAKDQEEEGLDVEKPSVIEQMLPCIRKQRVLLPWSHCSPPGSEPSGNSAGDTELPLRPLSPQDLPPLLDGVS